MENINQKIVLKGLVMGAYLKEQDLVRDCMRREIDKGVYPKVRLEGGNHHKPNNDLILIAN